MTAKTLELPFPDEYSAENIDGDVLIRLSATGYGAVQITMTCDDAADFMAEVDKALEAAFSMLMREDSE